jgi:hypothetical protein
MTTLDLVCDILEHHAIGHALIGAAALAAHGVARSTFDIDLLTTDARALDRTTWSTLPDNAAAIRRGDVDDPLAGVVRIAIGDDRPVDIVVGKHAWQSRAVDRALPMGGRVPVVLERDLILLKLYAGGSQDLWDIRELLRQAEPSLATEVSSDVASQPPDLRRRWESVQRGDR